jgi:hypothetical protein
MICESTERLLRRISFIGEVERFSFLRRPSHEELERLNQCDLAIFVGTNIFQPHVLGGNGNRRIGARYTFRIGCTGLATAGP